MVGRYPVRRQNGQPGAPRPGHDPDPAGPPPRTRPGPPPEQEVRVIRPRTALVAGIQHVSNPRGLRDLPVERGRRAEDYEFQIITVPRGSSVSQVRAELVEQAEYGRWEHARTRVYLGGGRRIWMRRRIIRVSSTLG